MMGNFVYFGRRCGPALVAAGLLSACATTEPQDYSPDYRYVATAGGGGDKSASASVLVPEACLNDPADQEPPPGGTRFTKVPTVGPHLPPGCANAYNLQRMAESQKDLIEGRQMGPGPAAPSARAARRYIDGTNPPTTEEVSAP